MPKRNDGNESAVQLNPSATIIIPSGSVFPPSANTVPSSQTSFPPTGPVSTPVDAQQTAAAYAWWDTTDMCPGGLDPRKVDRVIMKLLVSHFINPANISSPNLIAAGAVYNENVNSTGIRIVSFATWDATTANRKPSLVVRRGQQSSQRVAIGDRAQRNENTPTDTYTYTRLITGEHTIVCGSQVNGEIDELAIEVFSMLTGLSPAVRTLLPFIEFAATAISEVQLGDELGNAYSAAVKVEYKYELGVTVAPPVLYTLTYSGNGSTGGTAPTDTASPYLAGSLAVAKTAGTLVKTGSTFNGWNTAADGSGTAYAVGASVPITADTTLYARWV